MTLGEIASRVGCPLEGDPTIEIERVARIDEAGRGDLTFLANPKYASGLAATRASAIILGPGIEGAPCAVLRSPHPYLTFAKAVGVLSADVRPASGVHPLAFVASDATLGEDVSVGAFAVVGPGAAVGARTILHPHVVIGPSAAIGPDCVFHPHVSIRERSVIGARVILQDGVVIGSDGFGFAPRADGSHEKIPQTAVVVIEDDVEIGANTTVDRPAIGETRIKAGAKIDNLVQIAHGVVVGCNTVLAAQVGIAGSTVLGDNVTLAGQVGVAGHITVGDRVRAVGQSGITRSVPPDAFVSGYPAIDNLEWRKASAAFRRLPELRRRVAILEKRLAELDKNRPD